MFNIPNQSKKLEEAINCCIERALGNRDEFLTPELLLWGFTFQAQFNDGCGKDLSKVLNEYLEKYQTIVPEEFDYEGPILSQQMIETFRIAYTDMLSSEAGEIDVPHILNAFLQLENSFAKDLLLDTFGDKVNDYMCEIIDNYSNDIDFSEWNRVPSPPGFLGSEEEDFYSNQWKQYVTCLNDIVDTHNPLIGREREIERTIQILCRKDKNNPLHVGDPGVGKTALAYGLAERLKNDDVPSRIKGYNIYELDLGTLMAGTQYRGDLERRLKEIMEGLEKNGKCILYVDEIHTMIGAGRVEGSALDVSNLLKRHLEQGTIRFMGATTYEEYNKTFVHNKGFARRFEKIDVEQPSIDECKQILRGLKDNYENYHQVQYTDEAIDYAVVASDKYISAKFLPDKAIDLIDEAGAWRELHPIEDSIVQTVDVPLIAHVLSKMCNVNILDESTDETKNLETLNQRIKEQIFGQDEAVDQLSEAVLMGSAGIIDDNKPLASLLFVGPTGVGKTEVAKVLAKELAIPLLRFDMSEYAEKHTVAKLIGAPAGYVGYDDGGLLTDAIRKSPHCVLLFDELEKAHADIYNILLQVMDYAVLTDNRGQKADFRHVIFIMTTNAGAQDARSSAVGFTKSRSASEVMMKKVKQTFKPEFLNRLTDITLFHDMDMAMAQRVLDKKLQLLKDKLRSRDVTISLSDAAKEFLLSKGYSEEYGGREIERTVNTHLKPILMREILFGRLKGGGHVEIDVDDERLYVRQ